MTDRIKIDEKNMEVIDQDDYAFQRVEITVNTLAEGHKLKQQIINDNKIVTTLLTYHRHCNTMEKAYEDNRKIMPDAKGFLDERIQEESNRKEQIEEMIKYATGKDIEDL